MKDVQISSNGPGLRFQFGKNWRSFVEHAVNEGRVEAAVCSLRRMLKVESLQGKSFIDAGCGSGLFSVAAFLLGAERVTAFDYDQDAVDASCLLRDKMNIAVEKWEISQGSILDRKFLENLEPADVVYCWGVLPFTGDMWQAMDRLVSKVNPVGLLAISVYNRVDRRLGGSAMWWHIKRLYNRSSKAGQFFAQAVYLANFTFRQVLTLRNPIRTVREYGSGENRGMDFWHDMRDWLGGFPYEYASAGEVFNYLQEKFGLELRYLNTYEGHSCNEFTFRRSV